MVAAFIMGCFYLIIYSIVEYTGLKIGNQNGGTSLDNTNLEFFIYNMVLNKIIERIFIYLARFPSFENGFLQGEGIGGDGKQAVEED